MAQQVDQWGHVKAAKDMLAWTRATPQNHVGDISITCRENAQLLKAQQM